VVDRALLADPRLGGRGPVQERVVALRDVERNTSPNFDEGRYGLQELFFRR
jgi:hypothetical protein